MFVFIKPLEKEYDVKKKKIIIIIIIINNIILCIIYILLYIHVLSGANFSRLWTKINKIFVVIGTLSWVS